MSDRSRIVSSTIGYAIAAAALWWIVNRIYTINNVGFLARQGWPLNSWYTMIALGAALGAALGYLSILRRRRRAREIAEVARQLEMAHQPEIAKAPVPEMLLFKGWKQGEHLMTGNRHGVTVSVLDYQAVQGSGDNAEFTERTVVLFPCRNLPDFDLRARTGTYRLLGMLGVPEVTFDAVSPQDADTVEKFRNTFHLTTHGISADAANTDERPLRQLFTPRLMKTLCRFPGRSVQSHSGHIAVWHGESPKPPRARGQLLADAGEIFAALKEARSHLEPALPARADIDPKKQQRRVAATIIGVLLGVLAGFFVGSAASSAVFFAYASESPAIVFLLTMVLFFGDILGFAIVGGLIGSRFTLPDTRGQGPLAQHRRSRRIAITCICGIFGMFLGFFAGSVGLDAVLASFGWQNLAFSIRSALMTLASGGGMFLCGWIAFKISGILQKDTTTEDLALAPVELVGAKESTRQQVDPFTNLIGVAFIAFGILFSCFGGWRLYATYQFGQGASRADGQVVQMVRDGSDEGFTPVVRFTVGGREVEIKGSISSSPPAYSVGEHVTVLYHADQPGEAQIDSFTDRWLLPILFGGGGLLFAIIGAFIRRAKKAA